MIELGEERSIKDILATMERNRRKRDAKKNASAQTRREPKIAASNGEGNTAPVVPVRCDSGKCRTCATCVTNAKWERVFNEKFADPDYYKAGLPTRIGSTLSRLP